MTYDHRHSSLFINTRNNFIYMNTLINKTALVLGAGAGIGYAICHAFAEAGATVTAVGSNKENLLLLRQALPGSNHRFWCLNLAAAAGQNELVNKLAQSGYPHIVAINLQVPAGKQRVINVTKETFTDYVTQNLEAVFAIIEKTLLFQRSEQFGRWIGISSFSMHIGIAGQALYNTQKATLESFMRNIAVEEGKHGITANSIAPGFIETPGVIQKYPAELRTKIAAMNVLKRAGKAEEVAAAVCFLASPLAAYITGITLPVCGGAQLAWNL